MPPVKKIARHLRYAREVEGTKRLALRVAVDPSLAVPPHLIERVGDDSEEGSWTNGQSAPAVVHLGEERCQWDSESEESEEECEFTDGEDEESASPTRRAQSH